ncbi:uncharacterized protein METZ01_LOCUS320589, partial [marine metagenome]
RRPGAGRWPPRRQTGRLRNARERRCGERLLHRPGSGVGFEAAQYPANTKDRL